MNSFKFFFLLSTCMITMSMSCNKDDDDASIMAEDPCQVTILGKYSGDEDCDGTINQGSIILAEAENNDQISLAFAGTSTVIIADVSENCTTLTINPQISIVEDESALVTGSIFLVDESMTGSLTAEFENFSYTCTYEFVKE